ncbi:hypothetical protein K8T06_07975, partial [bacterium]|nr:hypothetical protein [bacterium]
MQSSIVAVVTGDVNASSTMNMKNARHLEKVLKYCFSEMTCAFTNANAVGFTNFRGDSWQFVINNPVMAVRSTLFFRSLLLYRGKEEFGKKLHTSAAIGFGEIDFLPTETSLAGGGEAYRFSGKRLDKLRRRVPGMGVSGLTGIDGFLDSLLGVVDALAHNWTASQARAVSQAMRGLLQHEIGKRWVPP